jgi:hypothetical protein
MGSSDISRLIGCDHATIIYGNRKVKEQLSIMNTDYINVINNWRIIFDENSMEVDDYTTKEGMIRNRIAAVLKDALNDGIITDAEVGDLLIDMLRKFAPEYVQEDE